MNSQIIVKLGDISLVLVTPFLFHLFNNGQRTIPVSRSVTSNPLLCCVHVFSGEVVYLSKNALLPVTLRSHEYEVFTVVPLKHLPNDVSFATIGLLGMFNSGGAVRELKFGGEDADVELRVRGSGTVGAYSSTKPRCVVVDSKAVGFSYDGTCGLISFELGIPDQ
jgi:hypothetical protein